MKYSAAERLLRSLGIERPEEIDLEAVAWSLGAKVKYRQLKSCEARICGCGDRAIISIDSEKIPQRRRFLVNPNYAQATTQVRQIEDAARATGLHIYVLHVSNDEDIDKAFNTIAQQRIAALIVAADPFIDTRRDKVISLSARQAVPTMYQFREHAAAGGLMSYGVDLIEVYRQVGTYAARILKGAKPADLPVMEPTKFEFVINVKTARTLGLNINPQLLTNADEVIE